MNCEYVAQVVRVEKLENGKTGVAVHLQMTMNFNTLRPNGIKRPWLKFPGIQSFINLR